MKLFENQVGRPSNETLKKRRNFSLAIALGVLALVGTASFAISKVSTNNLKGAASSKPFTIQAPVSKTVTKYDTYKATYKITNTSKSTIYYKWFTYANTNYNGTPTYVQSSCSKIAKGKSVTTNPTITLTAKNPSRAGKMKIYGSSLACSGDKKGASTSSKVYGTYAVSFKYSAPTTKPTTTTAKQASYNISGVLTGYGPEAAGANGAVACVSQRFSSSNYTYYDKEYGTLRVLANGSSYNGGLGCGTVIEIESFTEGTKKTKVRGIVLDNGSGSAIDLMTKSESYAGTYVGRQSIKYRILRKGW